MVGIPMLFNALLYGPFIVWLNAKFNAILKRK
jgi:hypothetical protein